MAVSTPAPTCSCDWLRAADGTRLHLVRWAPAGGVSRASALTTPTVLIAHGFGEHLGRYAHVAEHLTARGYAVAALDQRGHGRSDGPRGHVHRFGHYLADLHLAVRALLPPVVLLGHSFGALVALRYAEIRPEPLAGLVLSSPLFGLSMPVPAWKRVLGRLLSGLWPAFTLGNEVESAAISRDQAVVAAAEADPLIHRRASARFYTELRRAMRLARRDAGRLRLPVLVLQAGADRIVSPAATRAVFAALGSPNKQLHLYPGLYHELFNEPERDRPLADLTAWLAAQVRGGKAAG